MYIPDTTGRGPARPSARAAHGYGRNHGVGLVEGASPHELVRLMLDGAVSSLGAAQGLDADSPGERAARHRAIDRALAFVHELQGSLRDPDSDALSSRLFGLYDFVAAQLVETTRDGDPEKLRLARELLVPVADAWTAIAPGADAGGVARAA